MFRILAVALALASALVLRHPCALGGTIDSFTLPSAQTVTVDTPAPNNHFDQSANPNAISLPGTADPTLAFNDLQPIDIVFTGQPSTGFTKYFVHETVSNHSGVDWNGYRLIIGIREGADFSELGGTAVNNVLTGFWISPVSTSSAFTGLGFSGGILAFTGGTVSSGGSTDFTFTIDVVDHPLPFTLRQFPIAVPEPATAPLMCIAAIGVVAIGASIRTLH